MKRIALLAVCFLIFGELAFLSWSFPNRPRDAGPGVTGQIASVSFAPFRDGQSPLTQVFPSRDQIEEDMARLKGIARGVRTYTSREGMEAVPFLAAKYGLKVIQSAWITSDTTEKGRATNEAEVEALIQLANDHPDEVERVIVGNEVLLRRDLPPERLIDYIRQVKAKVKQPVSYADVWAFWLKHPQVAAEVDFITIHILPYWEDEPASVQEVGQHFEKIHRLVSEAFPGKPILIGEAGWPTQGRSRGPAVPGVVNAAIHLRTLVETSIKNGFDYNLVEAFDQGWKYTLEGTVGAKWGLIDENRDLKYPLRGEVPEDANWFWKSVASILLSGLMILLVRRDLLGGRAVLAVGTLACAQLLSVLLVRFACVSYAAAFTFWTSLAPVLVGLGLVALVLGSVRLAAAWAADRLEPPPVWLRHLMAVFAVYAVVQAIAIASDGRYRDIPLTMLSILAASALGLALLARMAGAEGLNALAGLTAFKGGRGDRVLALALPLAALDSIVGEGFTLLGEDFTRMRPDLGDQVPFILKGMVANDDVLILALLLALLALPHIAAVLMRRSSFLKK
ncbi:MAG: exo-beta-1,3-glucanase [Alphaproteobacteria bacterium]|nr:exo-beta-1,3-glucanase [Alphaproteobacteria bacterium]